MAVGIYKPGQGYWTRLMSAIAYGVLVLMGAVWLWDHLATTRIGSMETVYVQGGAAVLVTAVFGVLGFWLLARRRPVVDFMIATEGEMKKVNWSSRREILGSTWVVIGLTIVVAILCAVFDLVFARFFQAINVLEMQ
jgi:preprotein translocase SecE subunit